jgi:transcription elongation factor Elf1
MSTDLEHQRYLRQERAKQDKKQMIFGLEGLQHRPGVKVVSTMLNTICLCPFCFHQAKADEFVVSTKKGFHQGLGKCRACGNQSQWKNLRARWTAESLADWVYAYRADGFWKKVKYQWFNAGLARMGWVEAFWNRYKQLKGSPDEHGEAYAEESYAAYVERAQREQREQAQAEGIAT